MRRGLVVTVAAIAGTLAWGEWQNRRWSRTFVGRPVRGSEAIVVLGFKNPGAEANLVNRMRVRAALRSVDPDADTCLVFSGGVTTAGNSEARVMADYAVDKRGYRGAFQLEEASRTTWENVVHVIPLIEHADRITFASLPAHGLKARVYLHRQRPDLAGKLVRAADYRLGEWILLKPLLAAYGLRTLQAVRKDLEQIAASGQPSN